MPSNERTLLLTGATGFLGSNLAREFLKHDWTVVALVRPSSNPWRLRWYGVSDKIKVTPCSLSGIDEVNRRFRPSVAIHCATDYGRKTHPLHEVIQSNVVLPLQLLDQLNAKCLFVNTDTILDKRISTYSLSKNQFRQWMATYIGNRSMANVALEHFFGAGDDATKFSGYLLSGLCQEVKKIELTPGEQQRSFIHVADVARAFRLIVTDVLEHSHAEIAEFQVGNPNPMRLREYCELAASLSGAKTKLIFGALPYREFETMNVSLNLAPLTALGWAPELSVEEGLRLSLDEQKVLERLRPWQVTVK